MLTGEFAVLGVEFPCHLAEIESEMRAFQFEVLHFIEVASGWLEPDFGLAILLSHSQPIGARGAGVEVPASEKGIALLSKGSYEDQEKHQLPHNVSLQGVRGDSHL